MSKKIVIWAVAHLLIASWVVQEMRRRGKSESEAKTAGHAAGAIAGLVLASLL
jgi:hypothetical protein